VEYSLLPEEPSVGDWEARSIGDLVAELLAGEPPESRPWLIAIDGRSSAGKTTLSAEMVEVAGPGVVVHTDDVAWHQARFDWADLLVEGVLRPVHRAEAVAFAPPAWTRHGREGAIEVPVGLATVIVEGVGVGRRALSAWFDRLVWVQSDIDSETSRSVARAPGDPDAARRHEAWLSEERPFLARERPWQRAHVIVAGAGGHGKQAPDLVRASFTVPRAARSA
jgi:hypothetical protein